jgi:hypothetical protein
MFFSAFAAMYLMKEVLPLCRVVHPSGGQIAVAFWVVLPSGVSQTLEVGASSLLEASRGLRGAIQEAICRGGGADCPAQSVRAQGRVKSQFSVLNRAKKKSGQCPHFPPRIGRYSRRTGPDSACFRHFPVFSRLGIPFESHLGHGIPLVRGGFCSNVCTNVDTSL